MWVTEVTILHLLMGAVKDLAVHINLIVSDRKQGGSMGKGTSIYLFQYYRCG